MSEPIALRELAAIDVSALKGVGDGEDQRCRGGQAGQQDGQRQPRADHHSRNL